MMQRWILIMLLCVSVKAGAQENFFKYFADSTLYMSLDVKADSRNISFSNLVFDVRAGWHGTLKTGRQPMSDSDCRIEVSVLSGGQLIYAFSCSTLLEEWMMLDESAGGVVSGNQTFRMPVPRQPVKIEILRKSPGGEYVPVFSEKYYPDGGQHRDMASLPYPGKCIVRKGHPHKCVDIVIMSEGFTRREMDRFDSICNLFEKALFTYEPFKSNRNKFNISRVYVPSMQSGVSNTGFLVPTFFGFQYGTFGMERYIGTWSQYPLMLAASAVPCDHILVFANSKVYGGGGIYNQYAVFASSHSQTIEGMIHEFGHSFANLDDEYEGDVFRSKELPGSKCIMRTLAEKHFCPKCQQKIKKAIDYWSE